MIKKIIYKIKDNKEFYFTISLAIPLLIAIDAYYLIALLAIMFGFHIFVLKSDKYKYLNDSLLNTLSKYF